MNFHSHRGVGRKGGVCVCACVTLPKFQPSRTLSTNQTYLELTFVPSALHMQCWQGYLPYVPGAGMHPTRCAFSGLDLGGRMSGRRAGWDSETAAQWPWVLTPRLQLFQYHANLGAAGGRVQLQLRSQISGP